MISFILILLENEPDLQALHRKRRANYMRIYRSSNPNIKQASLERQRLKYAEKKANDPEAHRAMLNSLIEKRRQLKQQNPELYKQKLYENRLNVARWKTNNKERQYLHVQRQNDKLKNLKKTNPELYQRRFEQLQKARTKYHTSEKYQKILTEKRIQRYQEKVDKNIPLRSSEIDFWQKNNPKSYEEMREGQQLLQIMREKVMQQLNKGLKNDGFDDNGSSTLSGGFKCNEDNVRDYKYINTMIWNGQLLPHGDEDKIKRENKKVSVKQQLKIKNVLNNMKNSFFSAMRGFEIGELTMGMAFI